MLEIVTLLKGLFVLEVVMNYVTVIPLSIHWFGMMSLMVMVRLIQQNGFIKRNYRTVIVGLIMNYNITPID